MNQADRASLITLALSWAFFAVYYLTVGTIRSPWFAAFGVAYMWIPGLVALALARREGLALRIWGKPNRWWLVAWLLPVVFSLASIVASLPLDSYVGLSALREQIAARTGAAAAGLPEWALWAALIGQGLLAGATVNLLAALGEELMWRGYLWERTRELGFWPASLQIGVVWGVWHAPLVYFLGYNYPGHRLWGMVFMVIFTVLLTPWMLYLRERGGAIFAPALFHGSLNATAGLSVLVFAGSADLFNRPNDLLVGLTGLGGFVVLALANLYLRRLVPLERQESAG
ncbi:CPBP family intramembrane glutamic endopeptidase [Oceanithermus sp.]